MRLLVLDAKVILKYCTIFTSDHKIQNQVLCSYRDNIHFYSKYIRLNQVVPESVTT